MFWMWLRECAMTMMQLYTVSSIDDNVVRLIVVDLIYYDVHV